MGFDDIMDALGEMADIADDLTNLPQVLKKIRTSSQKKPVSQQTGVPKIPDAQEEGSGSQAKTEKISAPERTVKG